MLALVGAVVVIAAPLGGFTIAGGHIPVLFHISEFVTIGGVALGGILISTPVKVIKATLAKMKLLLRKDPFDRFAHDRLRPTDRAARERAAAVGARE